MPPIKPGTRRGRNPVVTQAVEDEDAQKDDKLDILSFSGLPHAMWNSARYAQGLKKQADALKRRLALKAGGDKVEMQRLENQLLLTEEELDSEKLHYKRLEDLKTEFAEEDDFLDVNDEVKNIREGPEFQEFWEAMDEINKGIHPHNAEFNVKEGPEVRVGVPDLEAPLHPALEMMDLAPYEVRPFGAQVSRVLKVGERFMPDVTNRLKALGADKIKQLGWVATAMEDGTQAFMVKAGSWLFEMGVGATVGMATALLGEALGSKRIGTWLAFTGASAAFLLDGDYSMLIMTAVATGLGSLVSGYAKQRARERETDKPEVGYGKRFGFVRDGKKWYPAYQAVQDSWYGGLGVDRSSIVMVYGENIGNQTLHFQLDGAKLTPTWTKWHKLKIIHPRDEELEGDNSHLSGQLRDGLRDWYFLDDDETTQLLLGGRQVTPMYKDFKTHNDNPDGYNLWGDDVKDHYRQKDSITNYQKNLLDMKYSADLFRDYNYRFHSDYGTALGLTEAARGLQRHTTWYTGNHEYDLRGVSHGLGQATHFWTDRIGNNPDELNRKWNDLDENKWLLDTALEQMSELVQAQKTAAQEAGYPDVTTEKLKPIYPKDWQLGYSKHDFYIDTKTPYRAYLDLGKSLPIARNSKELEAQLSRISGMADRSYIQQNYLVQKAYTRYLMNQVELRGGGDALVNQLYYPARLSTPKDEKKEYHEDWGKRRLHNYEDDIHAILMWDAEEGNQYLPPWATSDDEGILPDFLTTKKNQHRIEKNEKTMRLMDAHDLPLSHGNGAAPTILHSFSPDGLHTMTAFDHRTGLETHRKNPFVLTNELGAHGNKFRGVILDTTKKQGLDKTKREKELAKIKNVYTGSDVIVHDPTIHNDPFYILDSLTWAWDPLARKYVRKKGTIEERDRVLRDDFAKKRKHHGMNYYEYREFIRDHGGKTPDEVYEQGAWKVTIHGKQPEKKKKIVLTEPKWNWSDLKDHDAFGKHDFVKPDKTKWEKLPDDKGYDSRKKALEEQRKKAAWEQAAKEKAAREKALAKLKTHNIHDHKDPYYFGNPKWSWDLIKREFIHRSTFTGNPPLSGPTVDSDGTGGGGTGGGGTGGGTGGGGTGGGGYNPLLHGPDPPKEKMIMWHQPEKPLYEDSAPMRVPTSISLFHNHRNFAPLKIPVK